MKKQTNGLKLLVRAVLDTYEDVTLATLIGLVSIALGIYWPLLAPLPLLVTVVIVTVAVGGWAAILRYSKSGFQSWPTFFSTMCGNFLLGMLVRGLYALLASFLG